MKLKNFSPILFLSSLGAGGISIMGFAFLQYTFLPFFIKNPQGLISLAQIPHGKLSIFNEILFRFLEVKMVIFAILHFVLTAIFIFQFFHWNKNSRYQFFIDPLKNSAFLAIPLSIFMSMNVAIGPIRFFIPTFAKNLQTLMPMAFVFWIILLIVFLWLQIKILHLSFITKFNADKISFGNLLHSFSLLMAAVVGAGIAAMSNNPQIAKIAFLLASIPFSAGIFLFFIKITSVFRNHFGEKDFAEKFLPSILIVIPNLTLMAISIFRFGHFFEKKFNAHLIAFFPAVLVIFFGLSVWYLLFGFTLLKKNFCFEVCQKFTPQNWGLICPIVAFGVLSSFIFSFFPFAFLKLIIIIFIFIAIFLFFKFLKEQFKRK